jgi:hypothetical protein
MKNDKTIGFGNIFVVLAVLFTLSACISGNSNTTAMSENDMDGAAIMGSTIGNYEDIEIPVDMKYINKNSMSIRTDSFRGGIIHYKGPIEANSLKEYIVTSMKKNKWKLAGEVSSQDIILAFTKPHRTCMIQIKPNSSISETTLTMYVTVDLAASRNLNAFGEPI